ncbi:hypothetical protein VW29_08360 [Devosia limi DSM 17137]|uniref:Class II flagellar assembly regulator n=1 Tax=Devosia limi DSM 17137 TaxID=1121477 RepID=A0A0F5LRL1_9HYPH|nr:flagellar assembly protein FliX [Devosia limi]KKB85005.1 hypothetical protein VW29_08360 [Devosia limi DSM 17137]
MRIDSTKSTNAVNGRSNAGRTGNGAAFQPIGGETPARVAGTAPMTAPAELSSLLALQGVEDPLQGRKKRAVARGTDLLDSLDDVKADLLVGRVSEDRLSQLMSLLSEAREQSMPGLDALLDDIELRVRVELAKFGRYPA